MVQLRSVTEACRVLAIFAPEEHPHTFGEIVLSDDCELGFGKGTTTLCLVPGAVGQPVQVSLIGNREPKASYL